MLTLYFSKDDFGPLAVFSYDGDDTHIKTRFETLNLSLKRGYTARKAWPVGWLIAKKYGITQYMSFEKGCMCDIPDNVSIDWDDVSADIIHLLRKKNVNEFYDDVSQLVKMSVESCNIIKRNCDGNIEHFDGVFVNYVFTNFDGKELNTKFEFTDLEASKLIEMLTDFFKK